MIGGKELPNTRPRTKARMETEAADLDPEVFTFSGGSESGTGAVDMAWPFACDVSTAQGSRRATGLGADFLGPMAEVMDTLKSYGIESKRKRLHLKPGWRTMPGDIVFTLDGGQSGI